MQSMGKELGATIFFAVATNILQRQSGDIIYFSSYPTRKKEKKKRLQNPQAE
jgi:hypothetical protein